MGRPLEVPIFPLPGVVLYPGVTIPLYVFEARYRALLADVLDGSGLLGLPLIQPGFEAAAEGAPPILPVFGVGSVERYITHEDGTSHILVLGRWKVRLQNELPSVRSAAFGGASYRRARVIVLEDLVTVGAARGAVRADLRSIMEALDPKAVTDDVRKAIEELAADEERDPAPVLHMLCTLLHPGRRQELLECDGAAARARRLRTLLAQHAGERSLEPPPDSTRKETP